MAEGSGLEVATASGVSSVEATAWDRLTTHAPPFVEHAFLSSLEDSGCVGPGTGWQPVPLLAYTGGPRRRLVGAAPAYLKTHSMGEFVYDWSWAEAAERAGTPYYPKLVVAAPFSPVAGQRLLVDPALTPAASQGVRRALLAGCVQVAREAGCAGVHVLFCTEGERDLAVELGFCARAGLQFHWRNEGYPDFAAFLDRFRSKQRNQIRRERRRVVDAGIEVRSVAGVDVLDEHCALAHRFYAATVDQFFWGRRYLSEGFFELLWARQRHRLQLTLASLGGRVIAGTLNLQKGGHRYGRYWGTTERHRMLHFEVCSYAPIEDCIREGLVAFEAGAGGGSHKYGRGFLPTSTWSAHLHLQPGFQAALADFCQREAAHLEAEAEELRAKLFVRRQPPPT